MKAAIGVVCTCALLLAGCTGIGPTTIVRDRFDYVTTISDSAKRQMLLNLLKVRYADAPVFMDVASVISSYSIESDVSLGAQYAVPGRGDTFGSLGASGRYSDRPTITYQPLAGDKFARSMMAPIPVTGILYLIESGYPADLVLRICVNTINGLENAYGGPGNPRPGSPKFLELMTALREAQATGGTGFRLKSGKDGQIVVMFIGSSSEEAAAARRAIRALLGLNATEREFSVVYGPFAASDTEIAILTRSIFQVMIDFASYVDVPAADLAEGRVYDPQRTAEQARTFPSLIDIRHGPAAPDDAYAAVRYRNQSFWIDDRDVPSKRMFSFIMFVFALVEPGSKDAPPVLTIPTG